MVVPHQRGDFLDGQQLYDPDGFPAPEWDLDLQRESMAYLGVEFSLLTLSSPSVYCGNKWLSRSFCLVMRPPHTLVKPLPNTSLVSEAEMNASRCSR